ncbi:MAG: hypothetical protein ABUL72_03450, partial [Armatimonadota bacterium]
MTSLLLSVMASTVLRSSNTLDEAWKKSALDAAFPFDGARYAGGDVHDPSIARIGGTYVMVHTSGREFCPISTSKDLLSWEGHGPVLPASPEWLKKEIPGHNSIWAP